MDRTKSLHYSSYNVLGKWTFFSLLFFYILDFLLKQFLSDTWDKLLFFICISCSIFYHFYVMWNFVPRYECCIWVMKTSNRRCIKVMKCKCGQKLFNQMLHEFGNIYRRIFSICLITLSKFCIFFTSVVCEIYNYFLKFNCLITQFTTKKKKKNCLNIFENSKLILKT